MAAILGPNNEHLAKVCEVMAWALETPAASQETQAKMRQFLTQIKGQIPPEGLSQLIAQCDPTVKEKLAQAFS